MLSSRNTYRWLNICTVKPLNVHLRPGVYTKRRRGFTSTDQPQIIMSSFQFTKEQKYKPEPLTIKTSCTTSLDYNEGKIHGNFD